MASVVARIKNLDLSQKRRLLTAYLQESLKQPREFPLSYTQEQLWVLERFHPGTPMYNLPIHIALEPELNRDALRKTLNTLVQRHDMLRARFAEVDANPVQIIEPYVEPYIIEADLTHKPASVRETALNELLNRELQTPFDLQQGPCVRYTLVNVVPGKAMLAITLHHILADGWSIGIFFSEFNTLYRHYCRHHSDAVLPPVTIDYCDYAVWQRDHLQGRQLNELIDYWKDTLAGAPHLLTIGPGKKRSQQQTFEGALAEFEFEKGISSDIAAFCNTHGLTQFVFLLSCYFCLLYRVSGQETILVGTAVANRDMIELKNVIGHFVNTLIIRADMGAQLKFDRFLKQIQKTVLDGMEHQTLPFEKLVNELNVDRSKGYSTPIQAVFNFQTSDLYRDALPVDDQEQNKPVQQSADAIHSKTAKFALNFTLLENNGKMTGGCEYNTEIYSEDIILELVAHYKTIVQQVLAKPTVCLLDIPLHPTIEEARESLEFEAEQYGFDQDFNF